MEVKLLDKAQIRGENWYYVSLPLDSNTIIYPDTYGSIPDEQVEHIIIYSDKSRRGGARQYRRRKNKTDQRFCHARFFRFEREVRGRA